jgi:hypothetical protein
LQKELFNGTSPKRKEGHAYTRFRLTVLTSQSTRDSGLPVSPTHRAIGLKPLVDKDWAAGPDIRTVDRDRVGGFK